MLVPFGPDIWIADGGEVEGMAGFHFPTRMAVIRLGDGSLMIWSPVAPTAALRAEVAALGRVAHLVAPNSLHHLFLQNWLQTFPEARAHAAPGLAEKRRDIAFASELGDTPLPDWAGEVDQVVMRGNRITEEVVFLHRASGTVLVTDLIQHLPRGWFRGWRALVARLDGMTGPAPTVPRKFRLAFTDLAATRAAVQRILAWPAERLVIAHGAPVPRDAGPVLRAAFGWALC